MLSLINNVLELLAQNGRKQADLCAYLNISTSTMTNWKNRNTDPPAKYIVPICEFFDISPYILLTGKEKKSSSDLSNDEQELLSYYKKLPPNEKMKLIGRAEALAELFEEQAAAEPFQPVITLRHSLYKVSAGTGFQLDDYDDWDELDVPQTAESESADFCLTITGNSMEPIYYDGDVVLVKKQDFVERGQIGIFTIENNGYIKKFGGDRLISLTDAYDDIMFSDYDPDSIRCNGLVIGRV